MQQFQVPQYIDIEDKIVGPLTIKQFVYILAGVGAIVILRLMGLPSIIFWPAALIVGGVFAALSFVKINGQPFIVVVNNAINYFTDTKIYLWKKEEKKIQPKKKIIEPGSSLHPPKLTESKLKELAWSLDINEKLKR